MNEKNSIAQSITKVKAVERINQNPEQSTAAPLIPYLPVSTIPAHAERQGKLLQHPHINISQYFAVVPDHSQHHPQLPAISSVPTPSTTLNTRNLNEGSSSRKRKAPLADEISREKLTCQKCGQPRCSDSNSRCFCKSPCQDCGLPSCPGRNSQLPTKDNREGWDYHHKKLKL